MENKCADCLHNKTCILVYAAGSDTSNCKRFLSQDDVITVHCKDCRYATPDVVLENMFVCRAVYGLHNPNHYCYYGKPRGDDE